MPIDATCPSLPEAKVPDPYYVSRPHPLQIAAWKKMGPSGRMALALGLQRQVRSWKRSALRNFHPDWTEEQVDRELAKIYLRART